MAIQLSPLNRSNLRIHHAATATSMTILAARLVGLTRGFIYAGARRVVASLWATDLATAELKRVYGAMKQSKAPAAALRQA
jgi:CHAT domain-containing protein